MSKTISSHTDAPSLEITDSFLGYWLRFVSNHVTNRLQQKLMVKGYSIAEWLVLRFLFSSAPCSSTAIAEALVIDKGVISRISDRLEKRKLIKRKTVPDNRRQYSIELTPAGVKLVPELAEIAVENDSYFFGHLPKKKFDEQMQFFQKMVDRFDIKSKPID